MLFFHARGDRRRDHRNEFGSDPLFDRGFGSGRDLFLGFLAFFLPFEVDFVHNEAEQQEDCDEQGDPEALRGQVCYGGLDLSSTKAVMSEVLDRSRPP